MSVKGSTEQKNITIIATGELCRWHLYLMEMKQKRVEWMIAWNGNLVIMFLCRIYM